MSSKLLAVGECMLELSGEMQLGSQAKLNFGGDVLNTALYYARFGGDVSFLTAMGDDDFSNQILKVWNDENIDTSTVLRLKDRLPGLYGIQTDSNGERSFHYWREQAPIKDLFHHLSQADLKKYIDEYQCLYFSGISISRWDEVQLEIFADWLKEFREKNQNKAIIFDLNYRPKCWQSIEQTKKYLNMILPFVTIIVTTFDDEEMLFSDESYQQTLDRYTSFGVKTIVIKQGSSPTIVSKNGRTIQIIPAKKIDPLDTTAAGDSFNAAFLASIDKGLDVEKAVEFAQSFAAEIIQHQGAIIDKKHTSKYINKLKEL